MKNILYKSHWKLARKNLIRCNPCWISGERYFSSVGLNYIETGKEKIWDLSEKDLWDLKRGNQLEALINQNSSHLNIFSKEFVKFNEDFIDKSILEEFLNKSREEILKVEGYKEVEESLIDTILLHIRVNLVYAMFVQWVSSNTNIGWNNEDKNNSLVAALARTALLELGVEEKDVINLLEILNNWKFSLDLNLLEWTVRVGENKKEIKTLNYGEVEDIVKRTARLGKFTNLDNMLGLVKVLGCYKIVFNPEEKLFISMCTDLFSVPESGWKLIKKRRQPVKYELGFNFENLEEFIKVLFIKLNSDSNDYPFLLLRNKGKYGGGFKYKITENNFFFLVKKAWKNVLTREVFNESNKNLDIGKLEGKFKFLKKKHGDNNLKENFEYIIENEYKFKDIIFLVNKWGVPNIEHIKNRSERLKGSSLYTKEIMLILNDERLPLFMRELKVENYMIEFEINYFLKSIEDKDTSNLLKVHQEARKVIIKRIKLLCNEFIINDYKNLYDTIDNLNSQCVLLILGVGYEVLANLIFVTTLKAVSGDNSISQEKLCILLANRLIIHFMSSRQSILKEFKNNKKLYDLLNQTKEFTNWSDVDKISLGQLLLDCILKTDVFCVELEREGSKTYKNIGIKREFVELLSNFALNLSRLPMVCKPLSWTKGGGNLGGYCNSKINYINNMSGVVHNSHKYRSDTKANSYQYDAINYLSSIKFKINDKLLDLLLHEWEKKESFLFNGENQLHPDTHLLKEGAKISKPTRKKILSHNQKYWNNRSVLVTATMYQNLDFYIPCFLDFRGRIYCYVPYLNYQGSDLARGLILFSNKGKITDDNMKYLYYYSCNVFGLNNKTYEKRLLWSSLNIDKYIENLNSKNIEIYNDFIKEVSDSKEPVQFLASLLAIDKARKTGYSDQPILFDATCSGLQHLAGICGDLKLAQYVNVIGDEKTRNDMYEEACKYLIKEISTLESSQKNELKDIIITRSSVKKSIMTIPYGISVSSLNEDLQEVFEAEKIFEDKKLYISIPGKYTKDGKAKLITGKNWGVLVNMIYKVLYSMHPVLKDFTDYLKDMSKLLLDLNCPVVWVTPSGMKINTTNIKFKAVKTKSSLLKNSNPITISIPTNLSDKVKTLNGVTPNLIHSLDSSNIHLLIQKILNNKTKNEENPKDINLYTIHDCFASTVDTMGEIEQLVRESFADIYFGDKTYINTMHNNFISQIKSFTDILIDEKNREYIIINEKTVLIPEIPKSILSNFEDNLKILRTSVINSPYLIN